MVTIVQAHPFIIFMNKIYSLWDSLKSLFHLGTNVWRSLESVQTQEQLREKCNSTETHRSLSDVDSRCNDALCVNFHVDFWYDLCILIYILMIYDVFETKFS